MEYRGIKFVTGNDSITDDMLKAVIDSKKMHEWCDTQVDEGVVYTKKVTIHNVKFFGPVRPEKLGFVMLEGDAEEVATGEKVAASCAFVRGGSVGVFVRASIIDKDARIIGDYGVFTEQIRYPMGKKLVEICAGCVDSETGDIKGVAMTELQEELGIIVNMDDVHDLGTIIPSGGGTYEKINLYYLAVMLTEDEFKEKLENSFGDESEKIRLKFAPLAEMDDFLNEIGDVKAECAWRRIQHSRLC
uniref:Nudix hydrolase domain-containing protein n=1 Tax=viral metagenome TaxID=1070528 RepID=A0A6C0HSC5_9ZZZZ